MSRRAGGRTDGLGTGYVPDFVSDQKFIDGMHRITGYWHERSALQSLAVRRLSGNDDCGPLFWHERRRCSRRILGDPLATTLVDPYFHLYFPPSFSDTHTDIDIGS